MTKRSHSSWVVVKCLETRMTSKGRPSGPRGCKRTFCCAICCSTLSCRGQIDKYSINKHKKQSGRGFQIKYFNIEIVLVGLSALQTVEQEIL